jgi:regulatory protein
MTITSVKIQTCSEAGVSVYRVELSDGALFSVKTSYINESLCTLNRELSPDEVMALHHASACFRCETAALRLVANAEQTSYGLSRKLEQRGHGASCVKAVMARLTDLEIVSDRRYAELWIQSRLSRGGDSPRRMSAALRSKGIDGATVSAAMKVVLNPEKEARLLQRFIEKKRLTGESGDERHFLKQNLRAEGFSGAVLQAWEDGEA